jgi:hypothetical protein
MFLLPIALLTHRARVLQSVYMKNCNYIILNEFEHYRNWYTHGRNSAAMSALSPARNELFWACLYRHRIRFHHSFTPNNIPQWMRFPLASYMHSMRHTHTHTHITLSCLELKSYFSLHHSQTVPEIRDQRVLVCDI